MFIVSFPCWLFYRMKILKTLTYKMICYEVNYPAVCTVYRNRSETINCLTVYYQKINWQLFNFFYNPLSYFFLTNNLLFQLLKYNNILLFLSIVCIFEYIFNHFDVLTVEQNKQCGGFKNCGKLWWTFLTPHIFYTSLSINLENNQQIDAKWKR